MVTAVKSYVDDVQSSNIKQGQTVHKTVTERHTCFVFYSFEMERKNITNNSSISKGKNYSIKS